MTTYYIVEAFGKTGALAGQRTVIGLEMARQLYSYLVGTGDYGNVILWSTEVSAGIIDKYERINVQ